MTIYPLRRISVRLTVWFSGILLLLVALLGTVLYLQLEQSLRADVDNELHAATEANLLFVEFENGQLAWEGSEPQRIVFDHIPQMSPQINLVRLLAADGRRVSKPSVLDQLPIVPVLTEMRQSSRESLSTARAGAVPLRISSVPVRMGGRFVGTLQIARSLAPLERTLSHVSRLLALGGLAALACSLAIGFFLARQALDPVMAINRAAQAIGVSNLSQRLHLPDIGDELSQLAGSFDAMLDRVEQAYRRQREFAADASHELRTPLALIKGEASLARRSSATSDEMRSALETIESEADGLTRLVEDLLMLARLDRGELLRADPVGLDELAHEIEGRYGRLARDRGLVMRVEAGESVVVRGDEAALRRVLINLTQNALQHTESGEVCVRVVASEEGARIEVSDTGSGVPEADQPRLFDRFYRADASRGRGGAGLGLSLCRDIMQAHHGTIQLQSRVGGGTVVTCQLPLLQS